jgi:F420-dependent methylenetetrahydromethanopterin dehydrogenase
MEINFLVLCWKAYAKHQMPKVNKEVIGYLIMKLNNTAGHRWLTPIFLATWEADNRRIMVQSQLVQIVHKTLS